MKKSATLYSKQIGFFTWILFLIVLLFVLGLNFYLLFSQSIRLDESQSIWASTKPVVDLLIYLSKDVAAPLYAVILHFWIQFFGPGIFAARILSLIFFILSLPVLYLLAYESSNRKVAMLTVLLFSLSPFIMWYTQEARMYTLFVLVTCLSQLFFLRLVRSSGKRGKAGFIISTSLGLYTHYFFAFVIITQFVYLVAMWIIAYYTVRNRNIEQSNTYLATYKNIVVDFIRSVLESFLFFAPWVIYVVASGTASNTQPQIPKPSSFNIFQAFVNFFFGFQTDTVQAAIISLWPIVIVLMFLVFTQKKKIAISNAGYFFAASFLPIILMFSISYFKPIFLTRYLIPVTPTLFFITAWLLVSSSKKISGFLTTFVIVVMFSLLVYQNVSAKTPVKEDYSGVVAYINSHANASDIILVSAPFTIYPMEYLYHGNIRIDTIPYWDQYSSGALPAYSDQGFSDQLKKYARSYNNMYVVLSYDQGYQKKIEHFLDYHYKRLVFKRFSQGLEVREYKLKYD